MTAVLGRRMGAAIAMKRAPILYLDIDGTLIHADKSRWGYGVGPGVIEFLEWAVQRFDVRWLSTRCRTGDAEEARRAFRLAGAGSPKALKRIHAAKWYRYKSEAIDLNRLDWWWIDNRPDERDVRWLRERGLLDHLMTIQGRDAEVLAKVRATLEKATTTDLSRSASSPPIGPVGRMP